MHGPQSEPRTRREPTPAPIDAWCLAEIVIHRWRWLVLGGCLMALAGLAGSLAVWKKTYMAVAQLRRYEPMAVGDFFKPQPLTADTFATLLKSPELLQRVGTNAQPPVPPELLSKMVFIKTEVDSDMVKVAVKGRTPRLIVDVANLYATQAVHFTLELQQREA